MPNSMFHRRAALLALCGSVLLGGCSSLPSLEGRQASTAITDTAETRLGKSVKAARGTAAPDLSGIHPLLSPQGAFGARVLLARAADRALDVQYYIWHADTTGYLMLEELWNAAERGVRVRLLVDDNGIAGLDPTVAALDSHRNIEVRLFNPFTNRGFKAAGYLTDFGRLNRRMHNKSFTADAQATIVGGRNIGDEYFGAGEDMGFADLDVLAVGSIASEVTTSFDRYWNSASAFPAESIVGKAAADGTSVLTARFAEVRQSSEATRYIEAVKKARVNQDLLVQNPTLEWAPVRLLSDVPEKIQGKAQKTDLLLAQLGEAFGEAQRQLDIVSPYFVPGEGGTESLAAIAKRGVALRIVTNSLAATDVAAVHAGYAKRRVPLLRSGARIYELKPDAREGRDPADDGKRYGAVGGTSSASLHAKTFAIDRSRIFVGSFNLDPRSVHLNTEMGVVIESPKLAGELSNLLDREIERIAYEVSLEKSGNDLEWVERSAEGEVRYSREPKTTFTKRFNVGFLELLPIEWLL